ncbi:MAG: sulfide/dihydroorotate dehydrogenase-like FAD/NAD-binding protein [Candidatus Sumerlaeia bacterium]
MNKIVAREALTDTIVRLEIEEPELAAKHEPGQFLILRPNDDSERIPLSISNADAEKGTVEITVQEVGESSGEICDKQVGDQMQDVVGPLGTPTHIEKVGTVVCVGGGVGIAPLHPIARGFKEAGNRLITILGARNKDLVIFQDRMDALSDELIITTDDGSSGRKGLVTDVLKELIDGGEKIDTVIAIGPPIMMKFVSETTRPYEIKTWVSLNTMMIDGTGMCGGCRVTVGGETKYVCVDGPEFDGHLVDFDEMMRRLSMYKDFEQKSYERFRKHREGDSCKIGLDK